MNIRHGNSRSVVDSEFYQRPLPPLPQRQAKPTAPDGLGSGGQTHPRDTAGDSYVHRIYDLAAHTLNGLVKQIVPWSETKKESTPPISVLNTPRATPVVPEAKGEVHPTPAVLAPRPPDERAPSTEVKADPLVQAHSTIDSNSVDTNGPVVVNNYYFTFNGSTDTKPFASPAVMQEAGFSPVSFPTVRPSLRYPAAKRGRHEDTIPDDSLLRARASRSEETQCLLGKTTDAATRLPTVPPAAPPYSLKKNTTEPKPAFSGGVPTSSAPATGNVFSFGSKPSVPEVKASGGFFKPGPPAVVPDDSGFAPDADDDDDGKKTSTAAPPAAPAPAPSKLTFGMGGSAAPPAPATGNVFSFGSKPSVPEVKASGGFFKPGPPAVVPDDSGFAPDADDDDDGKKTSTAAAPAAPAPAPSKFTFGMGGSAAPPAPATGNVFSFGAKPATTETKPSGGFFFGAK